MYIERSIIPYKFNLFLEPKTENIFTQLMAICLPCVVSGLLFPK